jgi:predicted nucleic acid-binding protein
MDLADGTLVALAEQEGVGKVFTLDAHFYAYRWRERLPFEILPSAARPGA